MIPIEVDPDFTVSDMMDRIMQIQVEQLYKLDPIFKFGIPKREEIELKHGREHISIGQEWIISRK